VTESVGPSTWAGRLAGAILDGLPGTTVASPCASERPGEVVTRGRCLARCGPPPGAPGHSGRLWQRHRVRAGRRVQRDARAPVAGAAPLGGPPRCGPMVAPRLSRCVKALVNDQICGCRRRGSNPAPGCFTVRGHDGGCRVTCDSGSPDVTARARRGPAVTDAVRTQRGPGSRAWKARPVPSSRPDATPMALVRAARERTAVDREESPDAAATGTRRAWPARTNSDLAWQRRSQAEPEGEARPR